ncbi:hypothetical protein COBT_002761, partial [Conglomerata obtusa]
FKLSHLLLNTLKNSEVMFGDIDDKIDLLNYRRNQKMIYSVATLRQLKHRHEKLHEDVKNDMRGDIVK